MIKILIGGSPCTYWSIAQTQHRETEASGMGWELFKNYLIAKVKFQPDFFLYENNKSAAKPIKEQIKKELGVSEADQISMFTEDTGARYIEINSALVSAQNRQRFYVHNCGNVQQPEDRGILIKDILETTVPVENGKCLSDNEMDYMVRDHQEQRWSFLNRPAQDDKSHTVVANFCKGVPYNIIAEKIDDNDENPVVEPINITNDGKSQTLKAQYAKNNVDNFCCYSSTYGATGVAVKVGNYPKKNGEVESHQSSNVYSIDGKSVTLTANGGGQGAKTGLYAVPVCHNIQQEVRVRKHSCDIEKFQSLLRESKKRSKKATQEIADKLSKPLSEVQHWFRKDAYFNVPDEDIWFRLKELIGIETDEFDAFVTEFEVKDGVFEKANRCYDVNGKMSTLMTNGSDNIIEPVPTRIPAYGNEDKSRPVIAGYAKKGCGEGSIISEAFPENPNKQVFDYIAEPVRVGNMPNMYGVQTSGQGQRLYSTEGKAVTISTGKHKTGYYAIPVGDGETNE